MFDKNHNEREHFICVEKNWKVIVMVIDIFMIARRCFDRDVHAIEKWTIFSVAFRYRMMFRKEFC